KARLELMPGIRTLGLRERSLLLLADGKPRHELEALYHGVGAQLIEQLIQGGYLQRPAPAAEQAPAPGPSMRSLAGARMYLFDVCERMFARRDPTLAQTFHTALRAARDRVSMLDVGEAMLTEVSLLAGPERAHTLREQLAQLLPPAGESTLPLSH
ncbi:MAG TPA: hypothetical protein PLL92_02590, partial [Alicycliphilus sp.]|nr:hypothetical protein [Alicycliphilus sp.]